MSAEQIVNEAITRAINMGDAAATRATSYGDQAVTASRGFASMPWSPISFTPGNVEPQVNIPANAAGLDTALFNSTYDRIVADLSTSFAGFFDTYFPNECDYIGKAQQWMCDVLSGQSSGLPVAIEQQIWERDRARIVRDANRVAGEAMTMAAAGGFPLPPGAARHAAHMAHLEGQRQIGESSRTRAIEQAKLSVENIRFCVQQALDYRVRGIAAAADYIKTLAIGPELAVRLSTASSDAQARLISAANTFYQSRIRIEEMKLDVLKFNKSEQQDTAKVDIAEFSRRLQALVQTLGQAARAQGDIAAAAMNAVHGSAQTVAQGELE